MYRWWLTKAISVLALSGSLGGQTVRADYVVYTVPGTDVSVMLEGQLTINTPKTATLKHPRGTLYLTPRDIQLLKSPSKNSIYVIKARQVAKSNNVDDVLALSKWALHNGMLDKCKSLLSSAWKIDPTHERLKKLAGLMVYLNKPVADSASEEARARELVGGRGMTASRSKHFLLLHDGDKAVDPVTKKTRAEMRLDLLETVYESYFLAFAFEGLFLRPPTELMDVVLFSNHADFMQMERRMEMSLRQVAGFYLPSENIAIFYDSGTTNQYKELQRIADQFNQQKDEMRRTRAPGAAEVIRFANTFSLLVDIERESEDVATVSHEVVHQLAANTGLFPHDGTFVRWVHEGLASFFESARLAEWSGVGVVDSNRIAYYRALEGDPVRGSLEFIVSDLGFLVEGKLGDQLPAYGQAWALTHFLYNERFTELIQFYRKTQEISNELTNRERAEKLVAAFDETIGDRVTLELEWRRYMRNLKTDIERLAESIE